ncbi:MAG TPA: TonB-dependent receptor [Methylibium sp.]|uniref:TonB-dependent receptor n=1 Tax=Methylibium sp. TaxID=2067992 RepID=UPI002DB93EBB|nr:TonB-dependent receptor [Methylibium sp.]HEU4459722.1 TonB-dependent receptor [Methylibium sp.]
MFKRTKLSASLLVIFGGAVASTPALAQQQLDRVEITGSAVRRIDAEASLPVLVLKREEIEKTGATSVVDLLQKLPGVQGATTEGTSVGGGGAGFAGISIHNIGETRTLVLLNGRRLAQFGGQTLTGSAAAVDLNTIPMAAIDRVEILTDGASALYGSDAIAGVVNFITRRNSQAGDITIGASAPKGGGEEARFSLSKGFGNLDSDGFNVLFALSADKRQKLDSTDRRYAKSALVQFDYQGRRYQLLNPTIRGVPANVTDDAGDIVSPFFLANGSCPAQHIPVLDPATGKTYCSFDFVAELEIYPERERQSFMASGSLKLGDNHTLFADALVASTENTARIAGTTASIAIPAGSALHDQYLVPVGITGDTVASWRGKDLGKRTDINKSDFNNFVLGMQGLLANWDYKTSVSYSESDYKNNISGYPGGLALNRLAASGLVNPFVGPGQQSAAGLAAIEAAVYRGYWDGGKSRLTAFDASGSRELMQLAGGPLSIGTGVSYYKEKFQGRPSLFAQGRLANPVTGTLCDPAITDTTNPLACDQRAGDEAAIVPYGADRDSYGVFAELVAPVAKSLELTAAVRYDKYSDVGGTSNGKASFRWTPVGGFLLRGSVGTGFKAPTVPQLNASPQPFGVTGGNYACTPELLAIATSLGAQCRPGSTQYDVIAGGNKELKPEKSRQVSIGAVFEPTPAVSLGADLWSVAIRDAFGQIAEEEAFRSPTSYSTWTTLRENSSGITYLALNQGNVNLGKEYYTGVDFNLVGRTKGELGALTSQIVATYMLREEKQLLPNGPYYSAIGNNNESLGTATFRWQGRWTTTLATNNFQHTLQFNFKSGYTDALVEAEELDASGQGTGNFEDVRLRVKKYVTLDWQTKWQATKQFSLTGGVLNLTDNKPPLSLAQGGLGKGQMFGYDDRYYDARGRTVYLNASYAF